MKTPGLISLFLFSSIISFAQVERKPAPSKQADSTMSQSGNAANSNSRKDMIRELDLSREQKIKLKEIREAGKSKKEAIENNGQLSEEEKKKQLRALQKEQAKNIQAILTDEQKEKFRTKRQAMMQKNN